MDVSILEVATSTAEWYNSTLGLGSLALQLAFTALAFKLGMMIWPAPRAR